MIFLIISQFIYLNFHTNPKPNPHHGGWVVAAALTSSQHACTHCANQRVLAIHYVGWLDGWMVGGFPGHSECTIMRQSNCCMVLEQMSHRQCFYEVQKVRGQKQEALKWAKCLTRSYKTKASLLQPKSNSVIKYVHLTFWVQHWLQPMSWRRRKTQRLSDMVLTLSLMYFLKP